MRFTTRLGPEERRSPSSSHHGSPLTAQTTADTADAVLPRRRATASSHLTAGATAARPRSATAMTWITTRPMPVPSSSILISGNAIHIGHSTGGGEVTRYVAAMAAAGSCRQGGPGWRSAADYAQDARPIPTACRSRCSTASARRSLTTAAQFYIDLPSGPFYGFNRPGASLRKPSSRTGGARG